MKFQRPSAGGGGGAPTNAEYVVLSTDGTLTNERVLTAGSGISVTDGGAGGAVTIAATGTSAPTGASYLTLGTDATLTAERVLTAGTGITLTDAGAGSTLTVATSTQTTIAYKSSDQTLIGTAFADVTGTGLSVAANTAYYFEFYILIDSDAVTTGIDVAVNGPASPTALAYKQLYWTSATATAIRGANAYDNNPAATASNGTAARVFEVTGIIVNGANAGTLIARAKREAVGTGPNARAGSFGRLTKLS